MSFMTAILFSFARVAFMASHRHRCSGGKCACSRLGGDE